MIHHALPHSFVVYSHLLSKIPHVSHLFIILADGKVAYVSCRNSIKGRGCTSQFESIQLFLQLITFKLSSKLCIQDKGDLSQSGIFFCFLLLGFFCCLLSPGHSLCFKLNEFLLPFLLLSTSFLFPLHPHNISVILLKEISVNPSLSIISLIHSIGIKMQQRSKWLEPHKSPVGTQKALI